jgi:hypothetical protein
VFTVIECANSRFRLGMPSSNNVETMFVQQPLRCNPDMSYADHFMCKVSQHLEIAEMKKTSAMIHSEDTRESKLEAMMFSFWYVLVMLQTPFARSKKKSKCFAVRMAREPIVHQRVTSSS